MEQLYPLPTSELVAQLNDLRARDRRSRLAQWLLIVDGLAAMFGGVTHLARSGAAVSLIAEPADDSCRCGSHETRSRLTGVRVTTVAGGNAVHREARPDATAALTALWVLLSDAVRDLLPTHAHAGFILDFSSRLLGAWDDWVCLDCSGPWPCLIVDLGSAGPLQWAGGPAVAGVPALVGVDPVADGHSLSPPDRDPEAVSQLFGSRIMALGLPLPCVTAAPHDPEVQEGHA